MTNSPLPAGPVSLSHRPQCRGKLSPCVTAREPPAVPAVPAHTGQLSRGALRTSPPETPNSTRPAASFGHPGAPQGTFTPLGPFPTREKYNPRSFQASCGGRGPELALGGSPPPWTLRCPPHPPGRFLAAGRAVWLHHPSLFVCLEKSLVSHRKIQKKNQPSWSFAVPLVPLLQTNPGSGTKGVVQGPPLPRHRPPGSPRPGEGRAAEGRGRPRRGGQRRGGEGRPGRQLLLAEPELVSCSLSPGSGPSPRPGPCLSFPLRGAVEVSGG